MSSQSWCGRAGVALAACLLVLLLVAHAHAGPVRKRDVGGLLDGKNKRPFCNAFTGCGRKRSEGNSGAASMGTGGVGDLERLASSSELKSITTRILAEAKLWEQLQNKMEAMEALAARMDNQPLYRRKRSVPKQSGTQLAPAPQGGKGNKQ